MYENMGIGVLNECYHKDKLMTHQLLTRELTLWGHHTLFMIAEFGEQMDFMEHSACQTKLNKIWKGKMALYTSTWKVRTSRLAQESIEMMEKFFPVFSLGLIIASKLPQLVSKLYSSQTQPDTYVFHT